ncbi:unnamed protein product [Allacma fusca]|uniref:Uncharacterized protein n=1 Tax=Allacma fusca TaxID=39272 RepID=A0A8J2JCU1_9HEXA|nr:unnamed protein product [Allacma fusca]
MCGLSYKQQVLLTIPFPLPWFLSPLLCILTSRFRSFLQHTLYEYECIFAGYSSSNSFRKSSSSCAISALQISLASSNLSLTVMMFSLCTQSFWLRRLFKAFQVSSTLEKLILSALQDSSLSALVFFHFFPVPSHSLLKVIHVRLPYEYLRMPWI